MSVPTYIAVALATKNANDVYMYVQAYALRTLSCLLPF